MFAFSTITLLVALRFFLLSSSPVEAIPTPQAGPAASSSYWVADIKRQGKVAFGDSSFQIFRNVKDFGAKG